MSVYQVDEYYIHITPTGNQKKNVDKVREHLIEGRYDHEACDDSITVDGLESENEGYELESSLVEILNG